MYVTLLPVSEFDSSTTMDTVLLMKYSFRASVLDLCKDAPQPTASLQSG